MKTKFYMSLFTLLGTLFFTGCSSDRTDEPQPEPGKIKVGFTMEEKDFGEDIAITRATDTPVKQTYEFGDCEAEVSIARDTTKHSATRTVTFPVHYTIRAYDQYGPQGELRGTFTSNNSFTPDPGSPAYMSLTPNQTYTFMFFNNDVTLNGNKLDIAASNMTTARIGRENILINSLSPTIHLTSKPVGCRFRTKIMGRIHFSTPITANVSANKDIFPQGGGLSLDLSTWTYSCSGTATASVANNSPATPVSEFDPANPNYLKNFFGAQYYYSSIGDYHSVIPESNAKDIRLNITGGKLYWEPLNMSLPLSATSLKLEQGTSYTVTIKLKPSFTYLFSDGSTGKFKDSRQGGGSKTAVAIVVDKGLHLAMALKQQNDINWTTVHQHDNVPINNPASPPVSIYDDMNGEHWTWDASGSVDGSIKANEPAKYPAFYVAAHYNPGVPLTGTLATKRWYLPSLGEVLCLAPLVFETKASIIARGTSGNANANPLREAIDQVGGYVDSSAGGDFFTSTEERPPYYSYWMVRLFRLPYGQYFLVGTSVYRDYGRLVLPFIKYQ